MNAPNGTDLDLNIAGMVHDLNNIFQTLVDVADVLGYESTDPTCAKLAATILRSVERGKRITSDLQKTGKRADAAAPGTRKWVPHSTALHRIVASAIAFIEDSQIAGRGPATRFACDIDPAIRLGNRRSDGWAWERVFINLFVNAARAMPEGGTVTVSARMPVAGQLEIRVCDEGCGIATELQSRLFDPHISGHASTGLGLHIVKTIVENDGGQVRGANRADGRNGAEFLITVPVESPNGGSAESAIR